MNNVLLLFTLCIFPAFGMQVTFYNIGQGNCTLVTHPDQKTMLLDAGFSKAPSNDPGCKKVINQIVEKIETSCADKTLLIVASHADKDHINLMKAISSKLIQKKFCLTFVLGGSSNHYEKTDGKNLVTFLKDNPTSCSFTFVGSLPEKSKVAQLKKLFPDYCQVLSAKADDKDINNTSIVIRTLDREFSTFLSGDATGTITKPIPTAKKKSASIGVQQLSHHGSNTHECTSDALVEDVDATTFIVSTGNSGQPLYHPRFEPVLSAVKFCIQKDLTDAPFHMLTHAHEDDTARCTPKNPNPALKILPYVSNKNDPNFQRVANYSNGFCAAVTNLPIYSTADSGNITCSADGISVSNPNSTYAELSVCVLQGIDTPNFNLINCLTLNNMGIKSTELKTYFTQLPENLKYLDLRNNNIGHIGIEHLIKLYKNHRNNLIVKLADNCLVDKKALPTVCNKKDIKAIATKNRIVATFTKKGLAKDTVESLVLSRGHSGNPLSQHAQAKAYAQNSSEESEEASKNKLETVTDDQEELVYELSNDERKLYIEPSGDDQEGYSYAWPGITDICLLSDPKQTVVGITTRKRSFLFNFEKNQYKALVGGFRYTNPTKPWKTIGKEFRSLDRPEKSNFHERTPFSNNGRYVITVSAKNKDINIYQMDPLAFDPRQVKLYKTIDESELKENFNHSIADIKRLAFTDSDHSVEIHFNDHTHGELRYIMDPAQI